MGGETKEERPLALLLTSGDVVVLGGPARTCYHGVPRIVPSEPAALPPFPHSPYLLTHRINLSIRQVLQA